MGVTPRRGFGVTVGTHVFHVDEPGIEVPRTSNRLEVSVEAGETVVLEMIGGEFHDRHDDAA